MNEAKAKRKAKYDIVTPAMEIFHEKEMVLERPPGMTYEEYRIMRRIQTEVIKRVIHRAGPKTNTKRLKYSRKKFINALSKTSAGEGDSGEVS